MTTYPTFIFFGTGHFAEHILKTLIEHGHTPMYIVTSPDKPVGRHQVMTPSAVKVIADAHNIKVFQPAKLRTAEALEEMKTIIDQVDVCVVADYGKILPQALLDLCPKGFLNIHPSLLPLHRGPAPLQATILAHTNETGISIIKIDADMDHGPLVAVQKEIIPETLWPCTVSELSQYMAEKSALLLMETLPGYVAGEIKLVEQDHDKATYTKLIEKSDAEISLAELQQHNLKIVYFKYCAYKDWPEIFFLYDGKRVKIKKMSEVDGIYGIDRVTPEGKNEMDFKEFVRYHPI